MHCLLQVCRDIAYRGRLNDGGDDGRGDDGDGLAGAGEERLLAAQIADATPTADVRHYLAKKPLLDFSDKYPKSPNPINKGHLILLPGPVPYFFQHLIGCPLPGVEQIIWQYCVNRISRARPLSAQLPRKVDSSHLTVSSHI